jgi:hypothetical protein
MPLETFFQEDTESALVSKVLWLQENLWISDNFFSNLLDVDEWEFSKWRSREGVLSEVKQERLREFWQMILHILSFYNYKTELARKLLEHKVESYEESYQSPYAPPWQGTSPKAYLEANGSGGVQKINEWVLSFRFADRYSIR